MPDRTAPEQGVAIVGMAGRFPASPDLDALWRNLRDGVDCLTRFSDRELLECGVDDALLYRPDYVKVRGVLAGVEFFDAAFFGYSPGEAAVMDPQQRLFLESAWAALEVAGHDARVFEGAIGLFAGASVNTYLLANVWPHRELAESVGQRQLFLANDKDHLTLRTAYKLDLTGPVMTVQTTCSTSLVAVHLACQSLLTGECDMALAGGVSVGLPQTEGYLYREGGILSPDGRCRAFDAGARGTVPGNGVGTVVLRRMSDALADGDSIRAVILGSATNNDGAGKVGYTAPSELAQAEVIREAVAMAGIDFRSITYVEGHGTATPLGDLVELGALCRAFRSTTKGRGFCALGSVKSNLGHLDAAAGMAGLIKAALALEHRQIPPSLHFEKPNPEIDFAASPFYVNSTLEEWRSDGAPRRAGVSSFGMGGTNAHVVLEEAPVRPAGRPAKDPQVLVLSARTEAALATHRRRWRRYLATRPPVELADVAFTSQVSRRRFGHRWAVPCTDLDDARAALASPAGRRVVTGSQRPEDRRLAFMFPGQGPQLLDAGLDLYRGQVAFRGEIDRCARLLQPQLGVDLVQIVYPREGDREPAAALLARTDMAQPALFVIEYALCRLLATWGLVPAAMIGHSFGEFVAATVAGVFELKEALGVVALRGRLLQQLEGGAMLAVSLGEPQAEALAVNGLSLAAINSPTQCVLSGPVPAIDALERRLVGRGVACRRLPVARAFHSEMMRPAYRPLTEHLRSLRLHRPRIPFLSNVSGNWISAARATDADYWAEQLLSTVRFGPGLEELLSDPAMVLLEVGPGRLLSDLARRQATAAGDVVSCLAAAGSCDGGQLSAALAQLWVAGADIDWRSVHGGGRRRVPLPTYPFTEERYWVEPIAGGEPRAEPTARGRRPVEEWLYRPLWRRAPPAVTAVAAAAPGAPATECWLLFRDGWGLGRELAAELEARGIEVCAVAPGDAFGRRDDGSWVLDPARTEDYRALLQELVAAGRRPRKLLHLWTVSPDGSRRGPEAFAEWQRLGFYSLLFLTQALTAVYGRESCEMLVLSSHLHDLTGAEEVVPEKSTLLALCRVIPQEHPAIRCRCIDVAPTSSGPPAGALIERLLAEITATGADAVVAYRGAQRWRQGFEPLAPSESAEDRAERSGGVYLITGGLGEVGLRIAGGLAAEGVHLVLTGRRALPPRQGWPELLARRGADSVTRTVRAVLELESTGADIWVRRKDVTDEVGMGRLLTEIDRRLGGLNGVIHAAGAADAASLVVPINELQRGAAEVHFRAKVRGVYVLDRVLGDRPLDFCVLMSSISTVLGGLGLSAYAAANLFMDGFAAARQRRGGAVWTSADWDPWPAETTAGSSAGERFLSEFEMTADEAMCALRRVLSLRGAPRVVVSTGDLESRLESWTGDRASREGAVALHPRPALERGYVAPRNELEERTAAIWQELLGIDRVGVEDDFFKLGGHSLLATRLMARLQETFAVELPLRLLFEQPTVAQLALAVLQQRAQQVDGEVLARALSELEGESGVEGVAGEVPAPSGLDPTRGSGP